MGCALLFCVLLCRREYKDYSHQKEISHQKESHLNWDSSWKKWFPDWVGIIVPTSALLCSTIKCAPWLQQFRRHSHIIILHSLLHGLYKAWMIGRFHSLCQCPLISSGCLELVLRWILRQSPGSVRKSDMVDFPHLLWSSTGETSFLLAILAALSHHSYPKQRTQERRNLGDIKQLSNLSHGGAGVLWYGSLKNEWRKLISPTLVFSMDFWSIDFI